MAYNKMIDEGLSLIDNEEWEKAREFFEDLTAQYPDRHGAYSLLGWVYRELDLNSESERTLRKAIEIDGENPISWCDLGCTLSVMDRLREAEEAFRRAREEDPDNDLALIGLGDVLIRTERYKEARDLLIRGTELYPDNYWFWLDLGRVYLELEHYNKAIMAFTRAAECNEDRPQPHRGIGMVYLDRGDYALAREHFEDAIEIDPHDHPSQRGLAEIAINAEDYPYAEEILHSLIDHDDQDCEAWSLLGHIYLNTKRIRLAEKAFDEALSRCRNLESAHRGLLRVYELTDRVDEAENTCERLRKMVDGELVNDEAMEDMIRSIDPSIQQIIVEFHSLGLMTASSCSGLPEDHPDRDPQRPYVYFWGDYEGAHHHLFTLADMAGWHADYGVNGWGVELSYNGTELEDVREAWAKLIQMARVIMPHLCFYIEAAQQVEWEKEDEGNKE